MWERFIDWICDRTNELPDRYEDLVWRDVVIIVLAFTVLPIAMLVEKVRLRLGKVSLDEGE